MTKPAATTTSTDLPRHRLPDGHPGPPTWSDTDHPATGRADAPPSAPDTGHPDARPSALPPGRPDTQLSGPHPGRLGSLPAARPSGHQLTVEQAELPLRPDPRPSAPHTGHPDTRPSPPPTMHPDTWPPDPHPGRRSPFPPDPPSGEQLGALLAGLPLRPEAPLMVHASLSGTRLSPTQVRDALLDALGPRGTLVVPAFTPENSDSSRAHRALVAHLSAEEAEEFRASMLPFEPDATPCPSMGALAECVRSTPGAVRSAHPQTSLAAIGPRAGELLAGHDPHCHLGERSPLAKLYDADAQVLLLRVGFEVCSAFHLAEYRMTPRPPLREYRCVLGDKGNWVTYQDLTLDDGDFAEAGARLPDELLVRREWSGRPVTLFGMRAAVDDVRDQLSRSRLRNDVK
ncbi:aminoglycoside N3'-acetyltransferase [Streptomyces sp. SAI-208]|uniref:AAC(3) family N-acetyltransferase n=1 Tax=Streptomyces sp. SAI-208 TaxID=2940550 RepID=UPI0024749A81|nr:AAC(3) family N-acetyltransferase [Streptomyces sp. SAI-208]MDH6610106.1 aminoglycoside N3'-acetyltransferase [Streptomyces sp. SAI-208]